ncbi:MAG: hypothetical protein ACM3NI_11675 [Bacteroidota bacterium]
MISPSDHQLQSVMRAAALLPPEKRDTYLRRIASAVELRYGSRRRHYADAEIEAIAQQALAGLVQHEPAA